MTRPFYLSRFTPYDRVIAQYKELVEETDPSDDCSHLLYKPFKGLRNTNYFTFWHKIELDACLGCSYFSENQVVHDREFMQRFEFLVSIIVELWEAMLWKTMFSTHVLTELVHLPGVGVEYFVAMESFGVLLDEYQTMTK